ncbi:hypothetical protein HUN01_11555 [Nostoc edaphicum CCNP1411]|uniref:Uncharacterized protein n=1 Tax=Nostoc edaphicum CCNP1411 TaxID=1472755 RepID=A0A7D7Q9S2_9NOSO|nr:hypothetical protein [Nostoc edaphicum]QMS88197.1 hypothetical protein HUN01_11555 [Nostoc edaphicum CCNP1411]
MTFDFHLAVLGELIALVQDSHAAKGRTSHKITFAASSSEGGKNIGVGFQA